MPTSFADSGILLTRTRVAVAHLVNFIKEVPELKDKVFPLKFVGQGGKEGTMNDKQQDVTLKRFRQRKRMCRLLF
jgi:ERCC4-related helicase